MIQRVDYYKFSHVLLPTTLFKYPLNLIKNALDSTSNFGKSLKIAWSSIKLNKYERMSGVPEFKVNIEKIDEINSLIIIEMPEASQPYETPFIGIHFDEDYNVRYFTYEIGNREGQDYYAFCEWNAESVHMLHNINHEICSREVFIGEASKAIKAGVSQYNVI